MSGFKSFLVSHGHNLGLKNALWFTFRYLHVLAFIDNNPNYKYTF